MTKVHLFPLQFDPSHPSLNFSTNPSSSFPCMHVFPSFNHFGSVYIFSVCPPACLSVCLSISVMIVSCMTKVHLLPQPPFLIFLPTAILPFNLSCNHFGSFYISLSIRLSVCRLRGIIVTACAANACYNVSRLETNQREEVPHHLLGSLGIKIVSASK